MHPQISEKGPGKCPICSMDLTKREKGGSLMAHRVAVTVGRSAGDYTEVMVGVKAGDKVISAGIENLIEGTPVQPTAWGPDGPKKLPTGEPNAMPEMKDMPGMPGMSGMGQMKGQGAK